MKTAKGLQAFSHPCQRLLFLRQRLANGKPPAGLAAPKHLAGIGRKRTRDNVNQGGFARTVGTEQTVKPRRQGERHARQRSFYLCPRIFPER